MDYFAIAAPFAYSILLRIISISGLMNRFIRNRLVPSIPAEYKIDKQQKETIADQAIEAHLHLNYLLTTFVSSLAAVVFMVKNQALGLGLIGFLVVLCTATPTVVYLLGTELGRLGVVRGSWPRVSKGVMIGVGLIVFDLALGAISILGSIDKTKF